jgi:glycosyltransferase domain-containing protein
LISNSSLTLIIATKNKPDLLRSVLKYYSLKKFPYKILIADDTNIKLYKKFNIESIRLLNDLNIEYFTPHSPDVFSAILELLKKVDTPYVLNSGDDDFFSLRAINKIIHFLDKNEGYVSAGGISVKLNSLWDSNHSVWKITKKLNGTTDSYDSNKIEDRLIAYTQRLKVTTYNITRTKPLLKAYKLATINNLHTTTFGTELLQNSLLLTGGKNKVFNIFYHFWFVPINRRQLDTLNGRTQLKNKNLFGDIVNLKTSENSKVFLNLLSKQLGKNLDKKTAVNLARLVYLSYWTQYFVRRNFESRMNLPVTTSTRNRIYLYGLKLQQRATSTLQIILFRNLFKEVFTQIYVRNVFLIGLIKLNDSLKIISILNNETRNFFSKVPSNYR